MSRLVLVKHSMPEIERDKPASAWKLGEAGRRRAGLLAARLKEFSPSVIRSSREPKAIETAEIVANDHGVPVEIVDGLEEHHRKNLRKQSSDYSVVPTSLCWEPRRQRKPARGLPPLSIK